MSWKYPASLSLVMAAVWLGWSGHFEPLVLGLGAASLVFVVWLTIHMRLIDAESVPLGISHVRLVLFYVPWLAKEILKSNLDVAAKILAPGPLAIAPRLLRVKASQESDLARVIYANSITLTPGTVSVDVRGGEVLVHALHARAAEGVESGEMDRRCAAVEKRSA